MDPVAQGPYYSYLGGWNFRKLVERKERKFVERRIGLEALFDI